MRELYHMQNAYEHAGIFPFPRPLLYKLRTIGFSDEGHVHSRMNILCDSVVSFKVELQFIISHAFPGLGRVFDARGLCELGFPLNLAWLLAVRSRVREEHQVEDFGAVTARETTKGPLPRTHTYSLSVSLSLCLSLFLIQRLRTRSCHDSFVFLWLRPRRTGASLFKPDGRNLMQACSNLSTVDYNQHLPCL